MAIIQFHESSAPKRCGTCGRKATYTEIACFHDSMQILGISYACEEHVGTPGLDREGRDVFVLPQILPRSEAQFWVYEFAKFASRD